MGKLFVYFVWFAVLFGFVYFLKYINYSVLSGPYRLFPGFELTPFKNAVLVIDELMLVYVLTEVKKLPNIVKKLGKTLAVLTFIFMLVMLFLLIVNII